jgi:hypothetical protein
MYSDEERARLIELYDYKKEISKNLKPCPFCECKMDGSVYPADLCIEKWKTKKHPKFTREKFLLTADKYRVICPKCGAAGPDGYTLEWAITNWNQRGAVKNEISH